MTNLQTKLDEMRKRCEAASDGVWSMATDANKFIPQYKVLIDEVVIAEGITRPDNCLFISSAKQDLPLLISALQVCLGALGEIGAPLGVPLSLVEGDIRQACKDLNEERREKQLSARAAIAKAEALLVGEGKDE